MVDGSPPYAATGTSASGLQVTASIEAAPAPPFARAPQAETVTGVSLRLRWPVGLTFLSALALLVLGFAALEMAARFGRAASLLPPPSRGTHMPHFETRIERLEALAAATGRIDCIAIGNSAIDRALDPEVIAATYREAFGRDLNCFNFGIFRATDSATALLARAFIRRYHPRLLVVGIVLPLYMQRNFVGVPVVLHNPWLRWQDGEFTPWGWAIDRSAAVRRILGLRSWTSGGFRHVWNGLDAKMSPYGYTGEDLEPPPPLEVVAAEQARRFGSSVGTRRLVDSQTRAFREILAVRGDTQLAVFEMPVREAFVSMFPQGRSDYEWIAETVGTEARNAGVPFWRAPRFKELSGDAWRDHLHLTKAGARVFSRWLGTALVDAVHRGRLSDPTASNGG
ncbi:MAG: hypothetical protein HYX76_07200 [Acidobacteria bacterium]|nr:hypothetical protein [Acidobacteriota bacterium]